MCGTVPIKSSKFKHLRFSENDNFVETNSVDSILIDEHEKLTLCKVFTLHSHLQELTVIKFLPTLFLKNNTEVYSESCKVE